MRIRIIKKVWLPAKVSLEVGETHEVVSETIDGIPARRGWWVIIDGNRRALVLHELAELIGEKE